jgi:hypothetical protein
VDFLILLVWIGLLAAEQNPAWFLVAARLGRAASHVQPAAIDLPLDAA